MSDSFLFTFSFFLIVLDNLESYMEELLDCLNKYEMESDWVTKTNGWIHPEIL